MIGRLGDIIELKYGKALPERDRKPGAVAVYGSSGVVGFHTQEIVEGPGIVVGRKGSIGSVFWSASGFFPIDTTFYVSLRSRQIDLRFVFYLLKTLSLNELNSDAAVPGLNREIAHSQKIRIAEFDEQRRIVELVSPFDDLIENNTRRIGLLEEAARMLYREWFIHYRFPGHEHVKVVDGLPEGWVRCAVGEVLELRYGKALKASDRIAGPYPVYGSSGIVGSHEARLVEGPAIIVGRKGNVGSVFWSAVDFWPIDTAYYIPKEQVDFWLYLTLPLVGFQNTDSGVPGLNRSFAYGCKLVRPEKRFRRLFNEAVEPLFAQQRVLENYNEKLAQARDLLLPRLMNGEIREQFPALYGADAYSANLFVAINMLSYAGFTLACIAFLTRGIRFLIAPMLFFVVYGALGNAIAHTWWVIWLGKYFPGFYTAQVYWILGPLALAGLVGSLKRAVVFTVSFGLILIPVMTVFMVS